MNFTNLKKQFAYLSRKIRPFVIAQSLCLQQAWSQDATQVTEINTAPTVRVCNLANFEAFSNLAANGAEIIGILLCFYFMLKTLCPVPKRQRIRFAFLGLAFLGLGLSCPPTVNLLIAAARDANLFS